jgi:hypothetical protein
VYHSEKMSLQALSPDYNVIIQNPILLPICFWRNKFVMYLPHLVYIKKAAERGFYLAF